MISKKNIPIDEIIAGIDNDFNLDNTDWVPRIATWTIEVLSQLNCTVTEKKKVKVAVSGRIANLDSCYLNKEFKVYDSNGCEIEELEEGSSCCNSLLTGNNSQVDESNVSKTLAGTVINNKDDSIVLGKPTGYSEYEFGGNKVTYPNDIIGHGIHRNRIGCDRNYIKVSDNQLELNFDTDYIYIVYQAPKTAKSEIYGCEVPVIPDDGNLKEAIKYYCMYKILCRGIKHPVFNLSASQYGTNPYYLWTQLREKAKRSVINSMQGDDKGEWKKALIDFTFD